MQYWKHAGRTESRKERQVLSEGGEGQWVKLILRVHPHLAAHEGGATDQNTHTTAGLWGWRCSFRDSI